MHEGRLAAGQVPHDALKQRHASPTACVPSTPPSTRGYPCKARPPLTRRMPVMGRDSHERAQGMAQPSWYSVRSLDALTGLSQAESSGYRGAAAQMEGGEDPCPPPNRHSPISTTLALPTVLRLLRGTRAIPSHSQLRRKKPFLQPSPHIPNFGALQLLAAPATWRTRVETGHAFGTAPASDSSSKAQRLLLTAAVTLL